MAVFIHGCFWHPHRGCKLSVMPKTRTAFWKGKLGKNAERDRRNEKALRKGGWKVVTVRECDLKSKETKTLAKVHEILTGS